jgi:hypothetical protein
MRSGHRAEASSHPFDGGHEAGAVEGVELLFVLASEIDDLEHRQAVEPLE